MQQDLKKARSVHAYVRGSANEFYEWLQDLQPSALPRGPAIWICGDCHVGNLGPLEANDGQVDIDIRDFDQAVIGNPTHDLLRLGMSLAAAARSSNLPGVTTAHMIEHMMRGYRAAFAAGRDTMPKRPEPVAVVMRRSHRRTWKELARERFRDTGPRIPIGRRYWPLSRVEARSIAKLADSVELKRLVRGLKGRPDARDVGLLDAAFWVKGCSSLGRLRYALLLRVGATRDAEEELCLIDVKEAVGTAAPRYPAASMPRDNANRVVLAARALTPALGERMLPVRILERSLFVRELRPKDLKIELEGLEREETAGIGEYLARIVGRAHARQMDSATRRSWQRELGKNRSRRIDAPNWLWSGIVRLLAEHERAYLEHCRRCAIAAERSSPGLEP
jgi:uncharacterized protein (DUF2252 family)